MFFKLYIKRYREMETCMPQFGRQFISVCKHFKFSYPPVQESVCLDLRRYSCTRRQVPRYSQPLCLWKLANKSQIPSAVCFPWVSSENTVTTHWMQPFCLALLCPGLCHDHLHEWLNSISNHHLLPQFTAPKGRPWPAWSESPSAPAERSGPVCSHPCIVTTELGWP